MTTSTPNISITSKLITIAVLSLILLIPCCFILYLTNDRTSLKETAIKEISNKWGLSQTVLPLAISIPVNEKLDEAPKKDQERNPSSKEKQENKLSYIHIVPDTLTVEAELDPKVRHRNIYDAVLYTGKIVIRGTFNPISIGKNRLPINEANILWDKAFATIGIKDVKGIAGPIHFSWNDTQQEILPGILSTDFTRSGVHSFPPVQPGKPYTFEIRFSLKGSQFLYIIPSAKQAKLTMKSTWTSPSFQGAFLPDTQNITNNGFTASWQLVNLNSGSPQIWMGSNDKIEELGTGVNFFLGVDHYQKVERSVKYAFLVIVITFFTFLITEVIEKKKFHTVQYILVGLMISIFYLLLLSLSEYMTFSAAYWIAFIMIASTITAYTKAVFKSLKLSLLILGILTLLYGYIYTLFLLENYALLVGSLGLFSMLTLTMYITRKVDWQGFEVEGPPAA